MALSFTQIPGSVGHYEGVTLRTLGKIMIERLPSYLQTIATFKHIPRQRRPFEDMQSCSGDREGKLVICSDCGKVHPNYDTVKTLRGSLVCNVDCGLVPGSRKRSRDADAAVDIQSRIQSMTPEERRVLLSKFCPQEAPPSIDASNYVDYPPPSLEKFRVLATRGPESDPAVWYKQMVRVVPASGRPTPLLHVPSPL